MTEMELRRLVTDLAEHYAEMHVAEWDPTLMKMIDIYNAHTPLARNIKYYPDLGGWCMLFVSVLYIQTGLAKLIHTEIGPWECMQEAKKRGRFRKPQEYVPAPGDLIFYEYKLTALDGTKKVQHHVGICTNADSSVIYTTEGNVQNQVLMLAHKPDDDTILGFWDVDFASLVKKDPEIPGLPDEDGDYILHGIVQDNNKAFIWKDETDEI